MSEDCRLSHDSHAVVAEHSSWINPDVTPPPHGAKVHVLSWWGVATHTTWSKDSSHSFAAWAPLPTEPAWLKERLRNRGR